MKPHAGSCVSEVTMAIRELSVQWVQCFKCKDSQTVVKMLWQKLDHVTWEQGWGTDWRLLPDEFLHVRSSLYLTYSLDFWQGWIASLYQTPATFQKLKDVRPWPLFSQAGQVRRVFRKGSGHAAGAQTGLQRASHSGGTLPTAPLSDLEDGPPRVDGKEKLL